MSKLKNMVLFPIKFCAKISFLFKVQYHVNMFPPVPKGWREKANTWDAHQRRASVDPTKIFWENKGPQVK